MSPFILISSGRNWIFYVRIYTQNAHTDTHTNKGIRSLIAIECNTKQKERKGKVKDIIKKWNFPHTLCSSCLSLSASLAIEQEKNEWFSNENRANPKQNDSAEYRTLCFIVCFGWNYSIWRWWQQLTDDRFGLLLLLPTAAAAAAAVTDVIAWCIFESCFQLCSLSMVLTQYCIRTILTHMWIRGPTHMPFGCHCFAALQSSQATTTIATLNSSTCSVFLDLSAVAKDTTNKHTYQNRWVHIAIIVHAYRVL